MNRINLSKGAFINHMTLFQGGVRGIDIVSNSTLFWAGVRGIDPCRYHVELVKFGVISGWSDGDRSVPISCRIRSNSSNSTLFRGGVRGIDPCRHCVEFGQTREIDDIDV